MRPVIQGIFSKSHTKLFVQAKENFSGYIICTCKKRY